MERTEQQQANRRSLEGQVSATELERNIRMRGYAFGVFHYPQGAHYVYVQRNDYTWNGDRTTYVALVSLVNDEPGENRAAHSGHLKTLEEIRAFVVGMTNESVWGLLVWMNRMY